jgi:guanosine-3',5'-bis(diphosphate) 3'-pyrophosphohydrolase
MNDAELITKAKEFATRVHQGQLRNDIYDNPYIIHPQEVVELVTASGGSTAEIAAAWLHDTVEDTPTTIEEIRKQFGDEIAEIVDGLTDFPEFEKLPLAERKAKQAERVRGESASVKRVKLADQASNVAGIEKMRAMPVTRGLEYADGAKKIAEECKGISPFLDDLFQERYQKALENLNNGNTASANI